MSNPNSKKPTFTLEVKPKVVPTPDDPAVSDKPEPIKLAEEPMTIGALASQGRDRLVEELRKHQEVAAAKEAAYKPPARTARQQAQFEAELAAGRRAQEKHAAQAANRPVQKLEPSDGYTTPVFRPGDHVPNMNSANPQARTIK